MSEHDSSSQSPPAGERGATWRRVDLHLHSPWIDTFALPSGAELSSDAGVDGVVEAYVDRLQEEGIWLGAITDYNGVRLPGFERLRLRAEAEGITLLPGAELDIDEGKYGLHVLVIFPEGSDVEEIDAALRHLDVDPVSPLVDDDGVHRPIKLRDTLEGTLAALRYRYGCLIILPHPGSHNKGFLKTYRAGRAAELLRDAQPDAVEHLGASERRQLLSTSEIDEDLLERLASLESSDPKSLDEIGTRTLNDGSPRATYVKLSSRSLGALRLALHDPAVRVAVGEAPPAEHARITAMSLDGGNGFLEHIDIDWNDDLNAMIGGRGAGKSAIIEVLRYALGEEPYLDHTSRLALIEHALGSGAKVAVDVERPLGPASTRRYRIVRIFGEEPRVHEPDGGEPLEIQPMEVFGTDEPLIFGQREIQAVAGDESRRLRLLDALIGEEAEAAARRVREARERIQANTRAILRLHAQLDKRDDVAQRLRSIEHRIRLFEESEVADRLRAHTDLSADEERIQTARRTVAELAETWAQAGEETVSGLARVNGDLRDGKSDRRALLEEVADDVIATRGELDALVSRGTEHLEALTSRLEALAERWEEFLAPLQEELDQLREQLGPDTPLSPDDLLELTRQRTALLPRMAEFERAEKELAEHQSERRKLLDTYREQRHAEYRLRQRRCDEVEERLGGRLALSVEFKGEREAYSEVLTDALRGSRVSADAIERLVEPPAADGASLADAVREGAPAVAEKYGLTERMSQRVVDWFTNEPKRLFDLELVTPPDRVQIELDVDGHKRPLEQLSLGERATAMLLVVFALEGRPLVLDQPEDDLDNRFVYDDIVALLREAKGREHPERRRQIIVATHNANIPVLGDAELILTLEAREDRAHVLTRASIDDEAVRDHVRRLLEGGEDAFLRRAEKYGGL